MTAEKESKRLVLYADDDADDRMLLSDTFQQVAPDYILETVPDGTAAMDYLKSNTRQPCLLILDLNMPGMNGWEVMKKLKTDQNFQSLPIVVFTTSSNPADKQECARYGIEMITKPINTVDFEQTANRLLSYCA
jgi:CheY-like chemotaxis protein